MTDWRPSATRESLEMRARLYALFRAHFARTGALEVETPILSEAGTTDLHIESFSTRFTGHVDAGSAQRWLRTSPEFAMKRLLAAGIGDCYELGRVFRNGEAGGRHNPEFTMLEWYRVGVSLPQLVDETVGLIRAAVELVGRTCTVLHTPYRDLFEASLGLDPLRADDAAIRDAARDIHVDPSGLRRDDWLDLLFTHALQRHFPADRITVVTDYPASQCALAKVAHDARGDLVARRFEVYLGALELANGYDELVDAGEQAARWANDGVLRSQLGRPGPPPDARMVAALQHGMPPSCGVALGVERLLMALLGESGIAPVLAFNFQRA